MNKNTVQTSSNIKPHQKDVKPMTKRHQNDGQNHTSKIK